MSDAQDRHQDLLPIEEILEAEAELVRRQLRFPARWSPEPGRRPPFWRPPRRRRVRRRRRTRRW